MALLASFWALGPRECHERLSSSQSRYLSTPFDLPFMFKIVVLSAGPPTPILFLFIADSGPGAAFSVRDKDYITWRVRNQSQNVSDDSEFKMSVVEWRTRLRNNITMKPLLLEA